MFAKSLLLLRYYDTHHLIVGIYNIRLCFVLTLFSKSIFSFHPKGVEKVEHDVRGYYDDLFLNRVPQQPMKHTTMFHLHWSL